MPFDGPELNIYCERLQRLSSALRGKLPDDFEWHFEVVAMPIALYANRIEGVERFICGTAGCALGLAWTTMPREERLAAQQLGTIQDWAQNYFGMTKETFQAIFYAFDGTYGDIARSRITPHMVATEIDRYLANGCK